MRDVLTLDSLVEQIDSREAMTLGLEPVDQYFDVDEDRPKRTIKHRYREAEKQRVSEEPSSGFSLYDFEDR